MEGMDINSAVKNNTDVTIETAMNDPAREILDSKIDIIKNRIKDLEKKKTMLRFNIGIQEFEREKVVFTGQSNQNKMLYVQQDFLPSINPSQLEGADKGNGFEPPYWREPFTMSYSKCNFPLQDKRRNMRQDNFLPSATTDRMIADNGELDWLEPSDWRRSLSWRDSLKKCLSDMEFL